MSKWTSPLKKGMIVICEKGLVVRVSEEPKVCNCSRPRHYGVKCVVLDTGGLGAYSEGTYRDLSMEMPSGFLVLDQLKILKFGFDLPMPQTLEDEFFAREIDVIQSR